METNSAESRRDPIEWLKTVAPIRSNDSVQFKAKMEYFMLLVEMKIDD